MCRKSVAKILNSVGFYNDKIGRVLSIFPIDHLVSIARVEGNPAKRKSVRDIMKNIYVRTAARNKDLFCGV